jgi:hypothetical protein
LKTSVKKYIDDYSIDESIFVVHSKVSHIHQASSWKFDSLEEAKSKMAKLIYDRIYDKFMRVPTQDSIELLRRVLG